MDILWLLVICAINGGISYWNARVVGQCWNDRPAMGLLMRLVLYSAAVQSAIGFSSVLLVGLVFLSGTLLDPVDHALLVKHMMNFWYVLVIIPVLTTGLVITIHSWVVLLRERSWMNLAITSWNTFAQIKNMYDAAHTLGPALDGVGDLVSSALSGGDGNSKVARLAIVLVILSLIGGVLITAMIIKANMGTRPIPIAADRAAARMARGG